MGPVGTGANRNEGADRAARVLTRHSAASSSPPRPAEGEEEDEEDHIEATPIDTYKEVLAWYREGRRAYPPPHRNLTRREAVLVRQLQVRAIWTPVFAKHVCPELFQTDKCVVCGDGRATMQHMLWDCQQTDSTTADPLPPRLESAVTSADYELQKMAAQLALAAIDRQRPNLSPPPQGGRR